MSMERSRSNSPTGLGRNTRDFTRPPSKSRSLDGGRRSLDGQTTRSERGTTDFLRTFHRSQSPDQLGSRSTQSEHEQGQPFDNSSIYDGPQQLRQPVDDTLPSPFVRPGRRLEGTSTPRRQSFDGARPLDVVHSLWSQPLDRSAIPALERDPRDTQLLSSSQSVDPRSSELSSRLPRSTEIWTPSSDSMGERGSNQTNDQDAFLRALGITEHSTLGIAEVKKYAQIIMDVVKTGGNEQELLGRLSEKSTQISRERDQANNRDVETLLKALGIRDDDLGSGTYLEARKHAQTIVRVIRTDGQDQEFNDASKALLKLAPERIWPRSLVNPRKDTIDWYNASWRNQHAMSKLDTTTWGGSLRKLFYQANQPIAGLTNTRLGNLGFIGLQAVLGTAYTSYIEKAFASSTLESSLEYATTARFFYSKLPNPLNQLIDTIQFQGVSIGLYLAQASHAQNATTGG